MTLTANIFSNDLKSPFDITPLTSEDGINPDNKCTSGESKLNNNMLHTFSSPKSITPDSGSGEDLGGNYGIQKNSNLYKEKNLNFSNHEVNEYFIKEKYKRNLYEERLNESQSTIINNNMYNHSHLFKELSKDSFNENEESLRFNESMMFENNYRSSYSSISSVSSSGSNRSFSPSDQNSITEKKKHPKKKQFKKKGYKQKRRSLTELDKDDIANYHKQNPSIKQNDIALKFGIERSTVSKILKKKREQERYGPDSRSFTKPFETPSIPCISPSDGSLSASPLSVPLQYPLLANCNSENTNDKLKNKYPDDLFKLLVKEIEKKINENENISDIEIKELANYIGKHFGNCEISLSDEWISLFRQTQISHKETKMFASYSNCDKSQTLYNQDHLESFNTHNNNYNHNNYNDNFNISTNDFEIYKSNFPWNGSYLNEQFPSLNTSSEIDIIREKSPLFNSSNNNINSTYIPGYTYIFNIMDNNQLYNPTLNNNSLEVLKSNNYDNQNEGYNDKLNHLYFNDCKKESKYELNHLEFLSFGNNNDEFSNNDPLFDTPAKIPNFEHYV